MLIKNLTNKGKLKIDEINKKKSTNKFLKLLITIEKSANLGYE